MKIDTVVKFLLSFSFYFERGHKAITLFVFAFEKDHEVTAKVIQVVRWTILFYGKINKP